LNNDDRTVAVHDESGQTIGLAPDEPGERGRRSVRGPPANSRRKTSAQQDLAHGLVAPGNHPTAQRGTRVVEAATDEAAPGIDDGHHRARLDVADVRHVPFEDPGMNTGTSVAPALEPKYRRRHAVKLTGCGEG